MTIIRQCEYEILPPHDDPPTDTDPTELHHPDDDLTAELAFDAWLKRPRRFILFTVNKSLLRPRRVSVLYQGFAHRDGSVVVTQVNGHPMGWYRSVVSAWRRLKLDGLGLYLAWMDPDPADVPTAVHSRAETEAARNDPSTWYISLPFTAFGATDARTRAADITGLLETYVPGVDRLDVTFGHGDDPGDEAHVFCDEPGCQYPPDHSGDHLLARERDVAPDRGRRRSRPDDSDPSDTETE